ncbi:MAG: septal ring lytic transglycosylase RlpA family protein [Terracidiphilus sp.]
MAKRRNSSKSNAKMSLRIWVAAGISSVLLVAGILAFSPRTVEADARLSRPVVTAPPVAPIASTTPVMLAPEKPAEPTTNHALHGVASWYGGVFNGRKTASGERYDMYAMTACHPTLPFGTVVRVVNRKNKRSVVVRITDRGYLYSGRILDLSYGAAQKIGMIKPGLAEVDLEVLSWGKPRKSHN